MGGLDLMYGPGSSQGFADACARVRPSPSIAEEAELLFDGIGRPYVPVRGDWTQGFVSLACTAGDVYYPGFAGDGSFYSALWREFAPFFKALGVITFSCQAGSLTAKQALKVERFVENVERSFDELSLVAVL